MKEEPRLSAEELIERLEPSLSRGRRVRALAALLAGLAGLVFVSALWWSEPGPLPGRTQLMFGLCAVFCLAWACYGGWLLTRRVPLFATDRVIAAWIALVASVTTTGVVAAVGIQRGTGAGVAVAAGGLFVAAALVLAVRAHARRATLLRRKRDLTGGP
jgi:membrane associated rhomboid family serine protease